MKFIHQVDEFWITEPYVTKVEMPTKYGDRNFVLLESEPLLLLSMRAFEDLLQILPKEDKHYPLHVKYEGREGEGFNTHYKFSILSKLSD